MERNTPYQQYEESISDMFGMLTVVAIVSFFGFMSFVDQMNMHFFYNR